MFLRKLTHNSPSGCNCGVQDESPAFVPRTHVREYRKESSEKNPVWRSSFPDSPRCQTRELSLHRVLPETYTNMLALHHSNLKTSLLSTGYPSSRLLMAKPLPFCSGHCISTQYDTVVSRPDTSSCFDLIKSHDIICFEHI